MNKPICGNENCTEAGKCTITKRNTCCYECSYLEKCKKEDCTCDTVRNNISIGECEYHDN